ncbi:MAG: GEVED domain-containing protein [Planctomycetes bacterium]|nr:GEVED domain-containing protein [Planctomycetota bacterium]
MTCGKKNSIAVYCLVALLGAGSASRAARIEISAGEPPSNDRCDRALPVGEVLDLAFSTIKATPDGPGDPIRGSNIWYCYTPSRTGEAIISLYGSKYDTMMAVYRGWACDPRPTDLIAYNDDFSGYESQISLEVVAGRQYLIEIGGFGGQTGWGMLTIAVEGQDEAGLDLGDAPDSANSLGKIMYAYKPEGGPKVQAHYPTSAENGYGERPIGPVHKNPLAVAFLGNRVSLEDKAEMGLDADVLNNIDPVHDAADQDTGDDGLVQPIEMPAGEWTTIQYLVTVVEPGTDLWVNVWCDWNRDGDWDDDSQSDPQMGSDGRFVSEWAVQNQFLFGLSPGTHRITSPAFIPWHPAKGPRDIWVRITLAEKPWRGGDHPQMRGNGGSGPQGGYKIGETEDHVFVPSRHE